MKSNRLSTIANDVTEIIGETPMVWLKHDDPTVKARIALKLESENPMKSVKDRLALNLIETAEREGKITPGKTTLIEATSGNTGIGMALVGAVRGYRVIVVMPQNVSEERRLILLYFGVELHVWSPKQNMVFGQRYIRHLASQIPDSFILDQFTTIHNAETHFKTTGPEIWSQTQGELDYFIAGVGTGGTLTGIGQFLKSKGSQCKVVALEPKESPVLAEGRNGSHNIQGIGAPYLTDVTKTGLSLCSEIVHVDTSQAIEAAKKAARVSGIFCGISGGAAIAAAMEIGRRPEAEGKMIVALIPSFGERYLTTSLFDSARAELNELKCIPDDFFPDSE